MIHFPLASLLDPDPCNPVIDLKGGAIRLGNRSHPVVRRNSGKVAVNPHVDMAGLEIVFETSIKCGLPVLPSFFKRIALQESTARAKTGSCRRLELYPGVCVPSVECSIMSQHRRLHIIYIIRQCRRHQEHADHQ